MIKIKFFKFIIITIFVALVINKSSCLQNKENILILVVDDLRTLSVDWGNEYAHTPNMKYLAANSVTFQQAYAQQALCAPSRNSMLTGRRPNSLQTYDFYTYWRTRVGNFTTLPQYFKENGYKTFSFGKVFHPGMSSNWSDDYPYSWSVLPYHPSTQKYKNAKVCINNDSSRPMRNLVCPVDVKLQPEKTLPDIQIADAAIRTLREHNSDEQPYFIAVGFQKPHIPLKFPKEYLRYFPLDNISLPANPDRPSLMPFVAWNPWLDVRKRDDIRALNIPFPFGRMPDEWTLKIKQSYFAAVRYIDDLIGNILEHVDLEKTIVVLTSDHGWSLGEHGEWAKYSNFEVSLNVPLLIHAPAGLTGTAPVGRTWDKPVELVDIFPTLVDLAGLPTVPACRQNSRSQSCVEGRSLAPLMKGGALNWKHQAFSQYPRPGTRPTRVPNSDEPRLEDIEVMGYSIRTERYRYTEWTYFGGDSCETDWDIVFGKELYDHDVDDGENDNLAERRDMKKVIEELRVRLMAGFS